MKIIIKNNLSEKEKAEVNGLCALCNFSDGTHSSVYLSNEMNLFRNLPCFFLGYERDGLTSFLGGFFPDHSAVAISAFVHPNYRKSGQFTELFRIAEMIYRSAKFPKLQFCINRQSPLGLTVAQKFGQVTLDRREYTMKLEGNIHLLKDNRLTPVPVTSSNVGEFAKLAADCFPINEQEALERFSESEERTIYAVLDEETPVGVFMIYHDRDTEMLHNITVHPSLRGKGYGKLLVDSAIREALRRRKPITLDVDSDNAAAFHLYHAAGFHEIDRTDYYNYLLS